MGGIGSMMDEMAKTLARRRAAAENKEVPSSHHQVANFYTSCLKVVLYLYIFITLELQDDVPDKRNVGSKVNGNSSALSVPGSGDSPLGSRKRSGSTEEESVNRTSSGADVSMDLDLLKQELLLEIRKEMNKVKQEIIEGEKIVSVF